MGTQDPAGIVSFDLDMGLLSGRSSVSMDLTTARSSYA
jgi:hypothetical protein